ncbi:hypothetical protein SKAU_G00368260 [Synaphobranchus kaupii]|uniref:Uncharacterized protein n=1 Tax=Synaphobranchus kaupii TaxID=118154 RepID=A0A9Q1IER2_SYNKA|nr:hypothetical protein SKAU_G00368260 [Synaphobranchus kaupii]
MAPKIEGRSSPNQTGGCGTQTGSPGLRRARKRKQRIQNPLPTAALPPHPKGAGSVETASWVNARPAMHAPFGDKPAVLTQRPGLRPLQPACDYRSLNYLPISLNGLREPRDMAAVRPASEALRSAAAAATETLTERPGSPVSEP